MLWNRSHKLWEQQFKFTFFGSCSSHVVSFKRNFLAQPPEVKKQERRKYPWTWFVERVVDSLGGSRCNTGKVYRANRSLFYIRKWLSESIYGSESLSFIVIDRYDHSGFYLFTTFYMCFHLGWGRAILWFCLRGEYHWISCLSSWLDTLNSGLKFSFSRKRSVYGQCLASVVLLQILAVISYINIIHFKTTVPSNNYN